MAEHVGDLGMAAAADDAILAAALQMQAVVVTLDADFHQLLAHSHASAPPVVRLRIEGLKADRLAAVIAQVVAVTETELIAGAVVSVTPNRIRVRTLPIN